MAKLDLVSMAEDERAAALAKMTDEQLAAVAAELATERTAVRLAQLSVQQQIDVRTATKGMPDSTRRIVQLALEGGIGIAGHVQHEGTNA